jgi:hypothetical protein
MSAGSLLSAPVDPPALVSLVSLVSLVALVAAPLLASLSLPAPVSTLVDVLESPHASPNTMTKETHAPLRKPLIGPPS